MNNLSNELQQELYDFQNYVESNFDQLSDAPVTSKDLAEFGRQVFYLFDAFKEHITNALD